jgi:hypothetical protein
MKICDWCGNNFAPNVSYQIYCSVECRESSTKNKVNERYLKKKRKRLSEKQRKCSQGCGTVLSVYNEESFCSKCFVNEKNVNKALKQLRGLFDYEDLR